MGLKLFELAKIIKHIINKHGKKYIMRNRKSNEIDGILFYLLHTQKDISMDTVTGSLNDFNKKYLKRNHISRQSFSSRSKKLPEIFFENVCFDICNTIDKMYKSKNNSYDICAVDGSDSNLSVSLTKDGFKANKNGKSITALNIGIYNVTKNYPVDIKMVKHKDERKAFLDCINGKRDFSNTIFVYDRGFDGINFFKKLENLKLKYICRLSCDLNMITISDLKDYIYTLDTFQTRIVKYKIGDQMYYLATNLYDDNEFTIDKLKQLYHERWTIEESFKYMKRNFNFGTSELESAGAIRKSIYCQIIIMKIVNLMVNVNKNKIKKLKNNRIINKKTLTDGLYRGFLFLFINGKLNRNNIKNFNNNFVTVITTNKGKFNARICVTPFMKWYTKQYFKKAQNKNQNKKQIKNDDDV